MRLFRKLIVAAMLCAGPLMAEPRVIVDFAGPQDGDGWRFFTDDVMGGMSTGRAEIAGGALTLTGNVSTANNGGFIQARLSDVSLQPDADRVIVRVKGNGERYFIHLRTTRTLLPWHYYQAAFPTSAEWSDVVLPLEAFERSHRILPARIDPATVTSVALVAYGRDHAADVSLTRVTVE